jgi:hypothetical protein
MDIHKPKPWHGVREFLKEYLIIVVGVLTALGAEQAVEWWHVQSEIREARESLHEEIAADASTAAFTMEEDRCLGLSLDKYEAWARGGARPERFRIGFPPMRTSTWEEVKASAVARMPLKERLALAEFYDAVANQKSVIEYQRNAYPPLFVMSQRTQLDKADAQRLLDMVAEARLYGQGHTDTSRWLISKATALGAGPKAFVPQLKKRLAWECGNGPPP